MDLKSKSNRNGGNDFLADINHHNKPAHHVTYGDGFRFGIGLITAHLLIALLIGGLAYALAVSLKIHF